MTATAPGWYPDPYAPGQSRWWDGNQWTAHAQPMPQQAPPQVVVVNAAGRQGGDGAQYVRRQQGHSLTLHILLCFVVVGFVTIPYYSISPNHYWHA